MGRVPEDESYKLEYIIKAVTDWQVCSAIILVLVRIGVH